MCEWTMQCLWGRQFQGQDQRAVNIPDLVLDLLQSWDWSG